MSAISVWHQGKANMLNTPTGVAPVQVPLLVPSSRLLTHLGEQQGMAQALGPLHPRGDSDEASDFHLAPSGLLQPFGEGTSGCTLSRAHSLCLFLSNITFKYKFKICF